MTGLQREWTLVCYIQQEGIALQHLLRPYERGIVPLRSREVICCVKALGVLMNFFLKLTNGLRNLRQFTEDKHVAG